MSYGYSARMVSDIEGADPEHIGVRLGKLCVARNVPVSNVAEKFGVTRQTVYTWFRGGSLPKEPVYTLVNEYLNSIA